MGLRTVYDSRGNPIDVFVDGGPIRRLSLAAVGGWQEISVAAACDLYKLRVPAGGRRVIFTSSIACPTAAVDSVPTEDEVSASEILDPGLHFRGCDRKASTKFFVALDPGDDTPQTDPTVLIFTEAAEA